jgi:hypothetical protein
MPRSILTEKLGRRGHHLTREYGVDPLEMVSVEDAMTELADTSAVDTPMPAMDRQSQPFTYADATCRSAAERMATTGQLRLAVIDRASHRQLGYVSLEDLLLGRRRFVEREESRERVFRLVGRLSARPAEQRSPECESVSK